MNTPLDATKDIYKMRTRSESIYCFLLGYRKRNEAARTSKVFGETRNTHHKESQVLRKMAIGFRRQLVAHLFRACGPGYIIYLPTPHHPTIATEVKSSTKKTLSRLKIRHQSKDLASSFLKTHKVISNGRAYTQEVL